MTLKRRAEISAVIFAHLLRYVRLSCKNLTIKKKIAIESRISVTDSKVQNTDSEIFAPSGGFLQMEKKTVLDVVCSS